MNYATIKKCDIANGDGVRVSLFVSGCTHHCKNCFNKVAWDFSYGQEFTEKTKEEIYKELDLNYICGLSLLGGEPFEIQNQRGLLPFLREVKKKYSDKNIWCYTGNTLNDDYKSFKEEKFNCEATEEMLSLIDVLVDGEYIEAQHDIALKFKGSYNQRIIDMNATRKENRITLLYN